MFSNFFFTRSYRYEIMWNNFVEGVRPQMTIWKMRIACWIPKDMGTHLEYSVIFAFPLQQWLHERASLLRYTYIACLVQYYGWEFRYRSTNIPSLSLNVSSIRLLYLHYQKKREREISLHQNTYGYCLETRCLAVM
jgi:hypothetical protein